MKRIDEHFEIQGLWLSFAFLLLLLMSCGRGSIPRDFEKTDTYANVFPDYRDVVIPPNIAPMNFIVRSPGDNYAVRLSCGSRTLDAFAGEDGKIMFPIEEWRPFLSASKGRDISCSVYADNGGKWTKYRDFRMTVAPDPIDSYVSYRLIEPGYEVYRQIGLYQRNITNFEVHTIYENNRQYDDSKNHCVNCHNYQAWNTDNMLFHIRGAHGGTMMVLSGKCEKMNMKSDSILSSTVYPSWHPRKPWIVFSSNKTGQTFHMLDRQKIEVLDLASDLVFYDAKRKVLKNILKTTEDMETFPYWAPDGKRLYYCVAHVPDMKDMPDSVRPAYVTGHYRDLHYNIMSMPFDEKTQTFGAPRMEVNCAAMGKSASVPRISPDGRFILFTMGAYGQFHIWHRDADLYFKDLRTGALKLLSRANSKNTESYHAWSSTGRWIVFSSRRDDGSYTRLYISYIDRNGRDHKAFLMPQEDPEQNVLLLKSYNVPEFTKTAVKVPASEFRKLIYGTEGTPVTYGGTAR